MSQKKSKKILYTLHLNFNKVNLIYRFDQFNLFY